MSRFRPRSLRPTRVLRTALIRMPRRGRARLTIFLPATVLPATEERLATRSEIEKLKARHLTRIV